MKGVLPEKSGKIIAENWVKSKSYGASLNVSENPGREKLRRQFGKTVFCNSVVGRLVRCSGCVSYTIARQISYMVAVVISFRYRKANICWQLISNRDSKDLNTR